MSAHPVVLADRVSVTVGGETLLPPVSFTAEAGTTLAITGANGSGKTTLLRLLAGLTRGHQGRLTVYGSAPNERRPTFRRQVAALLSPPPMARNLTLHEHLTMVSASWGRPLETARAQATELLSELSILRLRNRFPHELSSGQSQLFALAVTLARPCRLLLLDEPEQRLDHERVGLLAEALNRRADPEGLTVLATHSPRLADQTATQVLHLEDSGDDPADQR